MAAPSESRDPPPFFLERCFNILLSKPKMYAKFRVASINDSKVSQNFVDNLLSSYSQKPTPVYLARPRQFCCKSCFLTCYTPEPKVSTNYKLTYSINC